MIVKTTSKRRKPRQRRSQERVAKIIAAAGELLDEVGYAQLTTNRIAERADTSIGSLYQFFPNKEAVVAELVQGYRKDLNLFFERSVSVPMARDSIRHLVNVVVDGIEELRSRSPGFGSILWLRRHENSPDATAIVLDKDIVGRLDEILSEAYPDVGEAKRKLCMTVAAESTKALLAKVGNADAETQHAMQVELKRMLGLYLESHFQKRRAG